METIAQSLNQRREQLGISQTRLAEMAGISLPTIQRFFSKRGENISFETVCTIAEKLGIRLVPKPIVDAHTMVEHRAKEKAHQLVSMVQGTSSLEAQGLPPMRLKVVEQQLFYELMSGPKKNIWSA